MTENAARRQDRDVADMVADVGRSRWWWAAYGVLTVIAGVLVLAWPGITLVTLAVIFAVQLFVVGIFRVVAAFAIPDTSASAKVLSVVVGVLSFIAGIICLRSPLQTLVVLTLILGAFWLIHGVADIVNGISGRGEAGRGWTIVGGVIGVLGGIVVLSSPVSSAITLAWLLGVVLILLGLVGILSSLRRSEPAVSAPSPASRDSATSVRGNASAAPHRRRADHEPGP
jgi:uncharacterized membrane protein HdeD (DUF308 family)